MDVKLGEKMSKEETKRISFDREQRAEITNTTLQYIFDEEELITGWERIYTNISIHNIVAALKYRFGTGDKQKVKWHVEQTDPVADVVYAECQEYHARQHNIGVIGIYGSCPSGIITVVWHGFDKRIRER